MDDFIRRIRKRLMRIPVIHNQFGIQHINCCNNGECWLEEFIKFNFPKKDYKKLCIAGVFGERRNLDGVHNIIFWSGENLESIISHEINNSRYNNIDLSDLLVDRVQDIKDYKDYKDYMLSDSMLSLAFKEMTASNYMRFPLWISYLFQPYFDNNDIRKTVVRINQSKSMATRQAVCINSHDLWGTRGKICNDLENYLDITYAGKWRNNTNELWRKYNNNKLLYLKMFKFNICPENMDAPDYCTEKLFDALRCGCIPIYAGCLNKPEPGLINENFIIMWDLDGDNYENIKLVKRLQTDDNFYNKFMQQEKLTPMAVDYVVDRYECLKKKLSLILS